MKIDSSMCICDGCVRRDQCSAQRAVIKLQDIIARIGPRNVTIAVYIDKCPKFRRKGVGNGIQ